MSFRYTLLCLLYFPLVGCSLFSPPVKPDDPAFAPVEPYAPPPLREGTGAIYQSGHEISLYQDIKARRIGDTLTIALNEKTNASKAANTNTSKSAEVDVENPTIFGVGTQFNLPNELPLAGNQDNNFSFGLKSSSSMDGKGSSDQNNLLTGTITVTVTKVLANGNLVVRGEKWVHINQGDEYIRLTGIVRPVDIGPNNTVDSNLVANARLSYGGTGQVQESNVAGWLGRFFGGAVGGIFPF